MKTILLVLFAFAFCCNQLVYGRKTTKSPETSSRLLRTIDQIPGIKKKRMSPKHEDWKIDCGKGWALHAVKLKRADRTNIQIKAYTCNKIREEGSEAEKIRYTEWTEIDEMAKRTGCKKEEAFDGILSQYDAEAETRLFSFKCAEQSNAIITNQSMIKEVEKEITKKGIIITSYSRNFILINFYLTFTIDNRMKAHLFYAAFDHVAIPKFREDIIVDQSMTGPPMEEKECICVCPGKICDGTENEVSPEEEVDYDDYDKEEESDGTTSEPDEGNPLDSVDQPSDSSNDEVVNNRRSRKRSARHMSTKQLRKATDTSRKLINRKSQKRAAHHMKTIRQKVTTDTRRKYSNRRSQKQPAHHMKTKKQKKATDTRQKSNSRRSQKRSPHHMKTKKQKKSTVSHQRLDNRGTQKRSTRRTKTRELKKVADTPRKSVSSLTLKVEREVINGVTVFVLIPSQVFERCPEDQCDCQSTCPVVDQCEIPTDREITEEMKMSNHRDDKEGKRRVIFRERRPRRNRKRNKI